MFTPTQPDSALPPQAAGPLAPHSDAEEKAQAQREAEALLVLDQSIMKDRLTTLHAEVDGVLADLSASAGTDIASIPDIMERRLAAFLDAHKASLATSRQRSLFAETTAPLLASARRRAAELQVSRIHDYQTDVIARQNAALAERAATDENVFNNTLQSQYRDVILINLESLHASLPQTERAEKLAEASRDFYSSILDRRLELRPESAADMLRSSAIRQALGSDEARQYDQAAAAAIAAAKPTLAARDWIAAGLPPAEAEERAERSGESGVGILAEYRRLQADKDEAATLANLLPVRDAWSALARAGYRLDAAWAASRPASPALACLIRDLLDGWLVAGGRPPEPDYAAFLRYMALPRREIWAELADESAAYAFVRALGGPDGPAFVLAARRLAGSATPEDMALLNDLVFARDEFSRLRGREEEEGGQKESGQAGENREKKGEGKGENKEENATLNRFLSAFARDRRVKLERLGKAELLSAELSEIARSCMNGVISKSLLAIAQ